MVAGPLYDGVGPFLEEIEQTLWLSPNNAHYSAALAFMLATLGESERGLNLMRKSIRLNPHHPGWHHLVPYLDYYRQGEYEAALMEANCINTPEYFWDPLIRAAVLGQLGRRAEAKGAMAELLALVPDFENRGRSLTHRVVFLDEHVDMLLAGLGKAGLGSGVSP